ncbi:MAG: glycoside hydrolase family 1 protein [Verrucomicrobiae bacterium]|nr:glycoside hydrolase family 1 protein [Verrucomicrobiae bacterium]
MASDIPNGNSEFMWGVATSAYQHEGGYNGDGNPLNNWHRWERSRHAERSGASVGFWDRYEEDFDLAASLGLNAFRFGFEWARAQPARRPCTSEPPPWDQDVLDRYGTMAVAARRRGLEPVVTLHHFTHPAWLGSDPWLDPGTPRLFADFAARAVGTANAALERAGHPALRWLITVNEPNMLVLNTYSARNFPGSGRRGPASMATACCRLLEAHVRATRAIREIYARHPAWGRPLLSTNTYTSDIYWNDRFILDLLAAPSHVPRDRIGAWLDQRARAFGDAVRRAGLPRHHGLRYWTGALVRRAYGAAARLACRLERFGPLLDLLYERPDESPLDFIGIDYYDPFVAHMLRIPRLDEIWDRRHPFPDWLVHHWTSKWWDWVALPEGLGLFARLLHADFPGTPIVIAENGMAYRKRWRLEAPWRRDTMRRSNFLKLHLAEVEVLKKAGVPVRGYFHWSLTDNYEWGSFAPRFGLFGIDFHDGRRDRLPVDELGDNPSKTYADWVRRHRRD